MRYSVDANLLVLLVVGLTRIDAINRHRRLAAYDRADFERLLSILSSGSGLVISAYALAEVSNLAVFRVSEPLRSELRGTIRLLVEHNEELHVACTAAVARPEFLRLGLADAALIEQLADGCTLLTADAELAAFAHAAGKSTQYFSPGLRD